jgi:hypothetical protein
MDNKLMDGDPLDILGIPRERGDEIARWCNLGMTHYPSHLGVAGKQITWASLPVEEQRAAAAAWHREHVQGKSTPPSEIQVAVDRAIARFKDTLIRVLAAALRERDDTANKRHVDVVAVLDSIVGTLKTEKGHDAVATVADDRLRALEAKIAAVEEKMLNAYRGVWAPDTSYERGQFATFDGSMWACLRPTKDKPPSSNWQLCVKAGRDARNSR